MSILLVLWLLVGIVLDRILVVAPLNITNPLKKIVYFVVLAPYLVAVHAAQLITNRTIWGAFLTDWFQH